MSNRSYVFSFRSFTTAARSVALAAFLMSAFISALDTCPTAEKSVTGPTGGTYAVCAGIGFQAPTLKSIGNIASSTECASTCDNDGLYIRAVYDTQTQNCHIKDNRADLIWASDKRWDAIRLNNTLKEGTVIATCPFTKSNYTSASDPSDYDFGGAPGYTQYADYNFKTGDISQRPVFNTHHDMFCPGMSTVEEGRIMITGGSNAEVTSLYDPSTNGFTRGPDMQVPRGYHSSATLSNGHVFTIGGCYSGGITGQNGVPWLDLWYGTAGNGSTTLAGTRPDSDDQMCGVNVMFDVGKILSAGGSANYTDSDAVSIAHITSIGDPDTPSSVNRIADMNFARGFTNAVVLPDGTVLVTGGQRRSFVFTDTDGAMAAEIYNPTTNGWTKMAREAVPRNYHSEALLLPDARVWSGGGGLCYTRGPGNSDASCDRTVDHADGQIFSPPYLFKADGSAVVRPVISFVSNTAPRVGSTITVNMKKSQVATFALLRFGSSTHSVNTDQRRIPVTATRNGSSFMIKLPSDSGVLIPGAYYLFAVVDGVPSVAKTIRVVL
ncbi:hypothetical protein AMS68_002231 [Peltaster fructicola]|uniref:Galactose oxidase-like Early set domain-containing protein n=1 Tax=Peltaster fructicola TaxID=286661 RepID=A0A6H0XPQ8_9PEZI|nr:hypothetical protein AMS68_002231 [Peltaster fructicola]